MSILFEKITAVTMDSASPVMENAYVLVEGEKIASVCAAPPESFTGQRIDGRHKVLMPGLINAHTHLPMTALRGFADDYDLQTWLNQYIFPAEDKLTDEIVACCTDLALAEAIASGTSSVSDLYYFCGTIADRVDKAGVKANLSRGTTCFTDEFDFASFVSTREMVELVQRWHGHDAGRIKVDASIHAEYTSYPKVWGALAEYAAANGLGMHIHLSETKAEHDNCVAKYGKTPAQILAQSGVFDVPVGAAHCVWVDDTDIALLARQGATAVHNPVSNMKLASGIAPVSAMLAAGVNVALGTDGVSSNNSHDLFEEIKLAAIGQKVRGLDPQALTAMQALAMATVNGARAQQRSGECGRIRAGLDADLIMLDFDRPHLIPCHNVISNLVYSARGSDVVMNMVRGKIIYRDGEFCTIDIERVKHDVRKAANIF